MNRTTSAPSITDLFAHQAGPYWHVHRFDAQVLRHAHVGLPDHGYFDHPEDGRRQ